ncbi:MAG: OmpA family protein [Elusimicrobia bacterium]|nr:OmpA family protein [Elusimicrobiota bacterium]
MKRISWVLVVPLLLAGCASGKLKLLQAKFDRCELSSGELRKQVHEGEDKVAALQSQIKGLEDQAADLDGKLTAQQERVDSLSKSNQDLRSTIKSSTGQLSGKVAELVKEKDDISRSLDTVKNEKIASDRAKANLKSARDRLAAELAAAKVRLDELAAAAAADKAEKDKAQAARGARQAKAHEDLGALADAVLKEMQGDQVRIAQDGDSVVLTLQEPLLFKPQQAKLTEGGVALLDRLGRTLQSLSPRAIRVEGHSDNSTIKWELFGSFTSHWDLSSARATAVARYLHEHAGLEARRLTAAGFGEFHPIQGNDTPEGREANRRVVLVIDPAGTTP